MRIVFRDKAPRVGRRRGGQGITGTGAPGANVMAIGLFVALSGMSIPGGTTLFQTSGHTNAGRGQGLYIEDTSLTDPDVAAHPKTIGKSSNGRYFRLAPDQIWRLDHFGIIGAGNSSDATNDYAALQALKAYQAKYAQTGLGYGTGGQLVMWGTNKVHIGANTFDLSDVEMNILGEHRRGAAEARSALLTTGTTAFRIQNADTTGATGTRAATAATGGGSSVTGVATIGDYSGTESEAHGWHVRGNVALYGCAAYGFAGDGFFCQGDSEDPTRLGNVNMTLLQDCVAQGCRNGFVPQGADANNVKFDSCQAIINRAWGFKNLSFLGALHINCDASQNGLTSGAIPTVVTYSGNRYSARKNGTWSNAPSGTTVHTADWLYISAGGANAPLNIAAWDALITYRDGGSFRADGGGNAANVYIFDYHEGGQGLAQIDSPALVLSGQLARSLVGVAALDHVTTLGNDTLWFKGGVQIDKAITAAGPNHEIGPKTGTAADLAFNLHTTNFTVAFTATRWSAGVPTVMGGIQWFNGSYYLDGTFGGSFRCNNVIKVTITTDGLTLPSGSNPTFTEIAAASIATPAASTQTLFIDSADHKLKRKDSSGTVTIIA